jgi:serine/threonine protein kinase/streptogramin lyase
MPLEGQHLGHYHLLRLLGSGGMGEVYLAEDARIGQQVAIKVIRAEGIAYPESESAKEAARLFEREAKAIARLDHPNILPLYAYGEEILGEQLLTYLVMPYRKEGTLASWLRQRGSAAPPSPAEVAPLLQQAAEALQHAHNQHVIHQDIKPANFLIRLRDDHPNRPDLLLADFGIAKLTSATASASQSIRGTPTYMAPEQWDGHPVPATDQYALAIMVYELLAGCPPFQGGPGQVMRQHYLTPPPAPSTLNPRLSPAIDAVLLRALSKQFEERFPSVVAFAQAFQEVVHSSGELRATLAISPAEAATGTTRSLTMPEGRRVSVTVPAGVRDGSILRLEGQGMPYYLGGPAGLLVLTMRIAADSPPPLSQASTESTLATSMPTGPSPLAQDTRPPAATSDAPASLEPTIPASNESDAASTILAAQAATPATKVTTPARQTLTPTQVARSATPPPVAARPAMGAARPAKGNTAQRIVLIGLAGLIVVALASGIVWFTHHQTSPSGSTHTAPAGVITEYPILTPESNPIWITGGPDGNLWFADIHANQIGRISPSGSITEFPIPTPMSNPVGITAGPDGNLWFTEEGANANIERITTSGSITEFPIPTPHSEPWSITAGPDGNLWFTELANQIGRISPSGSITEFPIPTPMSDPVGITAGPDGNVWFTEQDGNQIGRISTSGSITEFPVPTSKSWPGGITAGPDGNVWFTEQDGNQIGRISTSGSITEFPIPTPMSDPVGITAGPDGNVWFTESGQIGRITSGK